MLEPAQSQAAPNVNNCTASCLARCSKDVSLRSTAVPQARALPTRPIGSQRVRTLNVDQSALSITGFLSSGSYTSTHLIEGVQPGLNFSRAGRLLTAGLQAHMQAHARGA